MPEQNRLRRLLRQKQVDELIGIGRDLRIKLQKAGQFPAAVILSKNTSGGPDLVGYFEDEVVAWLASLERQVGVGKPLRPQAYETLRNKAAARHRREGSDPKYILAPKRK